MRTQAASSHREVEVFVPRPVPQLLQHRAHEAAPVVVGHDRAGCRQSWPTATPFFCAIDPSVRQDWANMHTRRLAPAGTVLTRIFPIAPGNGPPYAVDLLSYKSVLELRGLSLLSHTERVDAAEQHRPGGAGTMAPMPNTGLVSWARAKP